MQCNPSIPKVYFIGNIVMVPKGYGYHLPVAPEVRQRFSLPFWKSILCICHLVNRLSGEGNGTPLQYSCLENPMDGGACRLQSMGSLSRTRLSNFTFTFHFHALEKAMATHSSVLAWRIPGTGEPGGLPSMGSHRLGHDWSDLAAANRLRITTHFSCKSVAWIIHDPYKVLFSTLPGTQQRFRGNLYRDKKSPDNGLWS